ncbi:MAG: polysaccharide biosynthesis tyrosine autokinase [Deltaproteobacteria bacterium]|nr:polysaccharide biosynthesis tyrosine autokinase [Deltaproteobacteria bacterium]
MADTGTGDTQGTSGEGIARLQQYLGIIWKRFWIVLLAVAIGVGGAFLITSRMPKKYRATASVEISLQAPQILGKQVQTIGVQSDWWSGRTFLKTQYKILKSRFTATNAAKRLKDQDLWKLLGVKKDEQREPTEADYTKAAGIIRGDLDVEPVKESRIVLVKFVHTDPKVAAHVANALCNAYIEDNLIRKLSSTKGASVWLDEQLETIRKELDNAELAIQKFKEKNNILSVSLEDRINILSNTIQTLTAKRDQAMVERLALAAKMAQLRKIRNADDPINDPALTYIKSPVIETLKEEYVKAYLKLVELRGTYMEKHPKIQAQQALLAAIRQDLEREAMLQLQVLKAKYRTLMSTEGSYRSTLAHLKKEGLQLAKKGIVYNQLKRDKEHTAKMYELVLGRLKETDLAKELRTNNLRLVDGALVPAAPFSPKVTVNLAIGFALGLILGVGLAFLLHFMDNTVKDETDIEQLLKVPFLGWLPSFKQPVGEGPSDELYVFRNPKSTAAEACRSIRTNLLFMSPEKPLKTLLVTSAGPREGKTTVAVQLAEIMAMGGEKTLLVDTDMRRPRVHKALGMSNDRGVTMAIVGDKELDDLVKSTELPNLFVLPRGPSSPTPAELLQSASFNDLVARLAEKFDRVIFDSPPVHAVTDPIILSKHVDGTLLVVKSGVTIKQMALSTLKQLRDVDARVLGCILNDVRPDKRSYGYKGGYYYRRSRYYYYGDHQEAEGQ